MKITACVPNQPPPLLFGDLKSGEYFTWPNAAPNICQRLKGDAYVLLVGIAPRHFNMDGPVPGQAAVYYARSTPEAPVLRIIDIALSVSPT